MSTFSRFVIVAFVAAWSTALSAARPMMSSGGSFAGFFAAGAHSLLLSEDGTVHAVGSNGRGQLGNGMTSDSVSWVTVSGLANVVQVAAGSGFSLALKADGTVWKWGTYTNGDVASTPTQLPGLSGIVAIAAGHQFGVGVHRDGSVWTWGANEFGELGLGSVDGEWDEHLPAKITGLTGVTAIAAGMNHVLALRSDGTIWGWGSDFYGQLGDGTVGTYDPINPNNKPTPMRVGSLTGVAGIAAGFGSSFALMADGTARGLGYNNEGQLGNGTKNDALVPTVVLKAPSTPATCLVSISAGGYNFYATDCEGRVLAVGQNIAGQCGRPFFAFDLYLVSTVPEYRTAAGVYAGTEASIAFIYDAGTGTGQGRFIGFGQNSYGELGIGDLSQHTTPVVTSFSNPGAKQGKRTNFRKDANPSDVMWRRSDGTNVIWDYTTSAPSGFTPAVLPGVDGSWNAVATGDVTGDSISDVVWFQASTGLVAIWKMTSPSVIGSVSFPGSVGAGSPWSLQAVGDMDGDSRADLLWRNGVTGEVLVWYMKSDGTIDQAMSLGIVPLSYQIKALADVDGDWIKDIVFFQPSTGQVAIWKMHATGTFTAWFPMSVGAGSGWSIYKVGDFDGDGREDLFWRNSNGTAAIVYLNGPFVEAAQFLPGVPIAAWSVQAVGDYDADRREDLLWYSSAGSVVRWRMQGRTVAPIVETVIGIGLGWHSVQ